MANRYRYLPAMLLAVGVWIATPACAAQMYSYRGDRDSYRELERHAYDNGFREGVEEGRNDARRHRDFSYQRHDEYRDSDQGYHRRDGDRDLYRRSYRQGFQAGYSDAYNRNAGYGRNTYPTYRTYPTYPASRGGYASPAAQVGYRDGLEAGRKDARDRDQFDPVRSRRYREGDHDYDNRYGPRDAYKREYRAAFEQGYRQGYGRR